jgi:iron(III) transport system ATP-binding protein
VAVMRDGRIVQHASPQDLYCAPADDRLAQFVGEANMLDGTLRDGVVETMLGRLSTREGTDSSEAAVTVLIRPEQIVLAAANGTGAPGVVTRCDYHGHDTMLSVELETGTKLFARHLGSCGLTPGDAVSASAEGPVLIWPRDS